MSLDSSSSLESLASIENNDPEPHSDGELHRAASSPNLGKVIVPPPPLPLGGPRLSQGAFTSYVRHRGEPDGRTAPSSDVQGRSNTNALDCDLSSTAFYGNITRLPGTSTLNISSKFGVTRNDLQHQSYRSAHGKSDFRNNERPPVKISRPGGGGESDAAFTPSPPVVLQRHISSEQLSSISNPNSITLPLAHQSKIRSLYHIPPIGNPSLPSDRTAGRTNQHPSNIDSLNTYNVSSNIIDNDMKNYIQGQTQNQAGVSNSALRPDSSSSASSATDWESSGHATVLRRAPIPPLPPPRLPPAPGPLVENLHPLPPVYNNLSALASTFGEGNSSDSDFEKGFDQTLNRNSNNNNHSAINNLSGRNNMHTIYKTNPNAIHNRKIAQPTENTLERLSVRTEISSGMPSVSNQLASLTTTRKGNLAINNESILNPNNSHYYPAASDNSNSTHAAESKSLKKVSIDSDVHGCMMKLDIKSSKLSKDSTLSSVSKQSNVIQPNSGASSIQDSILASQLRHINRELTPTISEVYHERNIGLGLAPPLSKLLLNQNSNTNTSGNSNAEASLITSLEKFGIIDENAIPEKDVNMSLAYNNAHAAKAITECDICKRTDHDTKMCVCQKNIPIKKNASNKPWLSGATSIHNNIQGPDLTTAEIIERQTKIKSHGIQESTIKSKSQVFTDTYSADLSNLRHELTKNELIEKDRRDIINTNTDLQKGSLNSKRAISPFSELSKRDEGDGRSIADSHSSYNGVIINPQNTNKNCHTNSRKTVFVNNPSSEESDTMIENLPEETVEKQNRHAKSTHPRSKNKS